MWTIMGLAQQGPQNEVTGSLAITTQELADILGISRGTVDRALHNRGRVSPAMKKRIEDAAREYGYEPSAMAKALARAKNPVKIGFVLHLAQLPFAHQMRMGIDAAAAELANLGGVVLVEELQTLDVKEHIAAVDRLMEQGVQGIAVTPIDEEGFTAHMNQLRDKGVEIVTVNTDTKGIHRAGFVGLDNYRGGETAAGLVHLLLGKPGGKVLIISGSIANKTNSQRVDGFVQLLARQFPEIQVTTVQFNADDEQEAHRVVGETLKIHPDLSAIYMVSSGQAGACRALKEAGKSGDVRMVVFDTVPDTLTYIKEGVIDFIIDQNPYQQGNLPPRLLFDSIFGDKKIEQEHYYTEISIKTQYNL